MKKLLLTTAIVTAFATSASALEAGKMYVRGDLGYQISSFKVFEFSKEKKLNGMAGDIGFGYAISDDVRTDITLNFSNIKAKINTDQSYNISYDKLNIVANKDMTNTSTMKDLGFMANAYYDFNNSSAFTPYLMGGIGLNRSNLEFKYSGKNAAEENESMIIKSKPNTSFACQFGVGVDYEISKDIHLDLGYKFSSHFGKYKSKKLDHALILGDKLYTKDTSINMSTKGRVSKHNITAGVRFAF